MRSIWMLTTAILFLASSFFSVRLLLQLAYDAATAPEHSSRWTPYRKPISPMDFPDINVDA